jgi:hypothetical protein
MKKRTRDPGLEIALAAAGGVNALARIVDRRSATVSVWTHIPVPHCATIEAALGIPLHEQRPDVFPIPHHRAA